MAGLGAYLSHLREERGLSLDDMARATRVASRYLAALEGEDFAALPASVFTKGYIRAYCQALDVPADEALARYALSTNTVVAVAPTPVPVTTASTEGARRARGTLWLSFALLVGFGAALFAVALMRESARPRVEARRTEPPAAPAPAVPATVAAPAPEPEAKAETRAEAPPAPAPPATAPPATQLVAPRVETKAPPAAPSAAPTEARPTASDPPVLQLGVIVSPYRLVARTIEATWLRVRTDDGRATEETIPAGEVREWISNRPFVLTIGNAAGVALELNGQKLPPLGGRGVVISRLILPPGEP